MELLLHYPLDRCQDGQKLHLLLREIVDMLDGSIFIGNRGERGCIVVSEEVLVKLILNIRRWIPRITSQMEFTSFRSIT